MKIDGNGVLITGGASGIGFALAKEFFTHQNSVVVCDLKEEKFFSASKNFHGLEIIVCDVTNPCDREELLNTVVKKFPKLNILVNNAGVSLRHNFISPEADLGQRVSREINTNLFGPIELTRLFLPHLLKQEESAIVNMCSGTAYVPLADWPVYCATKAGLHSFSRSLRYQLKDTQVHVVEILPSWVDTEMVRDVDITKISPERVATEVMMGLKRNQEEIRIGQTGLLYLMSRLAPHFIFNHLNKNIPVI